MKKEILEEVLKLLHDQFDWNLTNSLTTTGEKLVADTIKALSIVKQEQMFDIMQQYASFCVKCDREKLPLLFAKEWFEKCKNK
jgi:hypothetical protein